jgi:hypothetical protein
MLREQGADTTPRAPAFVGEFDRETEIVWNRDSKRLVGFRRWILHEGRRVLQAELASIEYLTELPEERFRIALPPDVRWGGELAALTDAERSLGPREVAAQLFRAAADGDRTTLEKYIDSPSLIDMILDARPIELMYLGEPYRAANYGGVLIPYEVRCGLLGWTKRGELAIRNDNDEQRWEVDGGI